MSFIPNRNYVNGRSKEYRIMEKLRKEGFEIVSRSAGSHSAVDIWAIKAPTPRHREPEHGGVFGGDDGIILLIQSKGGKSGKRERRKVEQSGLKDLEGSGYTVEVRIV